MHNNIRFYSNFTRVKSRAKASILIIRDVEMVPEFRYFLQVSYFSQIPQRSGRTSWGEAE